METTNEILKPIHLVEMSFDDGNFELHRSLLMDDFQFKSPFGNFDIVEDYMNWLKSFYDVVNNQGGTRHLILNPVISHMANDKVHVTSYLIIINKKSMSIMGTSVLEDTLVLSENKWKCSFREISTDQSFN